MRFLRRLALSASALVLFAGAAPASGADDARQFALVGTLADGTRIFCPGKADAENVVVPLGQGAACFLDRSAMNVVLPAIVEPGPSQVPVKGAKRCR